MSGSISPARRSQTRCAPTSTAGVRPVGAAIGCAPTLVSQFGPEILAAPPKRGFDLLAWLVPAAVLVAGAAVVGGLAVMWSRSRRGPPGEGGGGGDIDPALERRIDADLAALE